MKIPTLKRSSLIYNVAVLSMIMSVLTPAISQTTVVLFDFGAGPTPPTTNCTNAATTNNTIGTPVFSESSNLTNVTYFNGSDENCVTFNQTSCARSAQGWNAADQYYQLSLNTTGFSSMIFTACMRSSAGTNAGSFQVRASTNGVNWTDLGSPYTFTGTGVSTVGISEVIPPSFDNVPQLIIQLSNSGALLGTTAVRVDKVRVSAASALPIRLHQFEASYQNKEVQLRWSTLSEINNDYFEVEKSQNGVDFSPLASVKGAGHAEELKKYQYTDPESGQGHRYYRLKQVDLDGGFTYSDIISVWVNDHTGSPLPHLQQATLDLSDFDVSAPIAISIVDCMGKILYTQNTVEAKMISLPLDALSTGLYFIRVTPQHQKSTIIKWVKSNTQN